MPETAPDPAFGPEGFRVTEALGRDGVCAFEVEVAASCGRFEGHFPGHPVLPAVSQLCDLVLPLTEIAWPGLGAPVGSPRMKFSRVIAPGDKVTVELERVPARRQVRFQIRHLEGLCTVGTLEFEV